jgi:hypothetical protein
MDIGTLGTAITGGSAAGGILLAAHWLWLRPKVRETVKEQIDVCRAERETQMKTCLTSIEGKIDQQSDELKYIRRRVDEHINHGGG